MPISHTHLRAFHAVAIHGSFTRAAEALHVTQPTLSGQVKELEERYKVKLFTRYGRKVKLTDFGQSALEITRNLFRYEHEVEQLFQSARGLTTGQLNVGADSPYIITPLLASYQRLYPGVQISIKYGNTAKIMRWLQSQSCDVAIIPNVPQDDIKLVSLPLNPDRLVVFVNQDHVWRDKKSVTLGELGEQRVIVREQGSETRLTFEKALQKENIQLKDVMQISTREGVKEAVAAGLGVGIVSENELGSDSRFHLLTVSNAELINS